MVDYEKEWRAKERQLDAAYAKIAELHEQNNNLKDEIKVVKLELSLYYADNAINTEIGD